MRLAASIIFCSTLLSGCDANIASRTVSGAEYVRQNECWFEDNGDFTAFVILSPDQNGYRPTFVSKRCQISGASKGAEYLLNLPAFQVTGDEGLAMRKKLIDRPILNNLENHGAYFSDDARVFDISATLRRSESGQAYDIQDIQELKLRDDLTVESAERWARQ